MYYTMLITRISPEETHRTIQHLVLNRLVAHRPQIGRKEGMHQQEIQAAIYLYDVYCDSCMSVYVCILLPVNRPIAS